MRLNVLALATLFPSAARPHFGLFVERQLAALAARPDVALTVISPVGLPPPPFDRLARYRALAALPMQENWRGLSVYRPRFTLIPGVGAPLNAAMIARAGMPLARRLHRADPFDVMTADFFHPDGAAAARIAPALGLPFTIKARGADIHHWGTRPSVRRQMVQAGHQTAALLAVSQALRADMIALGLPGERIHVHYTGCDQTRFAPRDPAPWRGRLGLHGPLIASVGALIPRKRHALLIEALALLPGVTLALAGDGPLAGELRALTDRLKLGERVRLLGSLPPEEVAELLAAADVMALVSDSEGLANAWVEALACGTPVVLSGAGGAAELVQNPCAGRIVAPTAPAIAEAIRAMLAAPPDRAAVRATVARFTWERNAEELEALLRGIVGR